jgi:hypothetical protein
MRLVDADEIRKKAVPHTRGNFGYSADTRKWAVLVGDIDDAPTVDPVKQEWVSVKDRMPEGKGSYLAYGNHILFGEVLNSAGVYVDKYLGKLGWKHQKDMKITHWMPMPEPPKGEEK